MKLVMIIILAVIFIVAGLRLFSRKLLYFPVPLAGPVETGAVVKEISLPVAGGAVLRGWVLEKDAAGLPFIFYFGGNAEEVSLNIADYIEKVDANVVMVNYRGYGLSTGRPTEAALKADALALYDHISEHYGLVPDRCGAWGRSLGSSMAAYLTWQRGLGRLLLTCPFDSIEKVAAGFYPGWLVSMVLTDRHRTVDFADQIQVETLILAAEHDEIIPMERTRALYDVLGNDREMVVIRDAGHNTISEFRGYYDAVNVFLKK
ncbi:MAG: hypothetical protein HUN04_20690 [Desulfobacter sp.]|nr:MAG: hypothetical protein HUN04_20690 [Desulfobacter sp.]